MTNGELIAALSTKNPNAKVVISIRQYNKVFPFNVDTYPSTFEKQGYEYWVKELEDEVRITITLPEKTVIRKLSK